jgi:hypothetical protein
MQVAAVGVLAREAGKRQKQPHPLPSFDLSEAAWKQGVRSCFQQLAAPRLAQQKKREAGSERFAQLCARGARRQA